MKQWLKCLGMLRIISQTGFQTLAAVNAVDALI
jgi:hypothetical protein